MSDKELNRVNVIQAVCEKRLRRRDAAAQLELTERQVLRLVNRYRESGVAGLAHGHRGKPGNHSLPESFKLRVQALVHENYPDFGPTLAAEKLRERHDINVSVETLRKWMIADGLWVPYIRRKPRIYQPRNRRDCLGELIQIDGSPHDWFEGRAPKCCLLVFVDDATGQLMHLRFGETESAFDYMLATREYIDRHGKPLVFYSDKHGIFRVNHPNGALTGTTQFGRVLHDIGVDLICANSPQAKGRVERANQTLQDRLIKEMRLEGISSIEEANAWVEIFISDFNRRFARVPRYPKNLHRPVTENSEELDDMFAWQETRKLTKSLTFRYDKMIYLVDPTEENSHIAGENIMIYDYPDGTLAFKYGHRALSCQAFDKLDCIDQGKIVDNKRLGTVLKLAQDKMDELDRQDKRSRSKSMPRRRAQARVQEQLRTVNPVLANPEEFRASLRK
ncbi:ISNCY family transposase [Salmonella enterica]|nr:ISNCY family transposase [Salmonella enterica]EDW9607834.1 ISNCY family transposase [Salmonella enterica subsp. houtenae serovar 50:z4,z23:-]ECJ9882769.1 ISNCY family transposase [Salmonella enterica]ECO9619170.1 ISNCY family transposase [Salmonella enterica]ECZ7213230.1 ISNCY family transposase [Salmonella enterica]